MNIFDKPFTVNHGAIPFDKITNADFEPAIEEALNRHNEEIKQIIDNPEAPSFQNTVVALERAGSMLSRVLGVFYPWLSANANDELLAISERVMPKLTSHFNEITLNEKLWNRVRSVHENFNPEEHDTEDAMLLKRTRDAFINSGAALPADKKEAYKKLSNELAQLSLKFEQNTLKEMARIEVWLTADDLEGLPESAIEAASMAAKAKGREGEYLVTLRAPSYQPFMKYSSRRDLREKLYMLYNTQCTQGEFSNCDIIQQIANKRLEIARILGFDCYADYHLKDMMAEKQENVFNMFTQLQDAYRPALDKEMRELRDFARQTEGDDFEIKPWDYSYYANLLKNKKFNFNDEQLRPYFELNNVIKGVFGLATRLYGLTFVPNHDAPVFHPDMLVYDVLDRNKQFLGMLYTDFFPRETKQSGAWMTGFRDQYVDEQHHDVRPLVSLTMNFTKPTESKPSLLTLNEVRTFLHEFGHALHGLLSRCRYASLSGTSVERDFVEMPSQFNENYLFQSEYLNSFARHYITDEPIPEDLLRMVIKSSQFGIAYACFRQLSFGRIDMAWHTLTQPFHGDVFAFENEAASPVRVFAPIEGCAMSPQFGHIFSGGYAAGYYGYKWAEMIEADAFQQFLDQGIFNPETAQRLEQNILTRGGSEHPMTLYRRFRGSDPTIRALLIRDGLLPSPSDNRCQSE